MNAVTRVGLLGALALSGTAARAQAGGDVSVRLLSTRSVKELVIAPMGENVTIKRCAGCKPAPLHSIVRIAAAGPALTLDADRLKTVEIAGELVLNESGNRVAAAAGRWRFDVQHGELRVVVTVPRERYVMAVLTSEAAADDPPAALRALAVVVRSFAFANTRKHAGDGFEFCDSTHCQAMRLTAVPTRIEDAVRATAGETLWAHGARVPAYFTQHCGGMSEDASALWGGARRPWLAQQADPYCQRAPSQWHTEIAAGDMRAALAREGWILHAEPDTMRVTARTASGRASRVEVAAGGQHIALAAASFRFAINRTLGWDSLRSDWYTAGFSGGRAVFDGRGYGHGVGLCQAGSRALAMAARGDPARSEREILRFYFPGTVVRTGPSDEGWTQHDAAGWTLLSIAPDTATLRAGNAAWAQAQALFPVQTKVRPTVRVFPDTDLFRQSTGGPGWALAATRAGNVSVQSAAVVLRHGPMEHLLLHEFLHVLVEEEAQPGTPLWLREGLVESLSEPHHSGGKTQMHAREIDAVLAHAVSLQQAEAAHQAAGMLVSALVAQYGLGAVRGWLHSGVPASVGVR